MSFQSSVEPVEGSSPELDGPEGSEVGLGDVSEGPGDDSEGIDGIPWEVR